MPKKGRAHNKATQSKVNTEKGKTKKPVPTIAGLAKELDELKAIIRQRDSNVHMNDSTRDVASYDIIEAGTSSQGQPTDSVPNPTVPIDTIQNNTGPAAGVTHAPAAAPLLQEGHIPLYTQGQGQDKTFSAPAAPTASLHPTSLNNPTYSGIFPYAVGNNNFVTTSPGLPATFTPTAYSTTQHPVNPVNPANPVYLPIDNSTYLQKTGLHVNPVHQQYGGCLPWPNQLISSQGDMPYVQPALWPTQQTMNLLQQTNRGIPSGSLPMVETVTPQMRHNIIQGKDINLASLLIPNYKPETQRTIVIGQEAVPLKPLTDTRLTRPLTITEFLMAFKIYKNVMCETYPHRRQELDTYQNDIVEMSARFGGNSFYEYHKAFSARAASLLANYGTKVDWGVRDEKMYNSIFAGHKAEACTICGSLAHMTVFCPQIQQTSAQKNIGNYQHKQPKSNVDSQGRMRIKFNGREICNNYNSEKGCKNNNCFFSHICKVCKDQTHSSINHPSGAPTTSEKDQMGNTPKQVKVKKVDTK